MVKDAIASTTFPWYSRKVLSALVFGTSSSCTINSTSSFFIKTFANSFSRANFSADAAACFVPIQKLIAFEWLSWYLSNIQIVITPSHVDQLNIKYLRIVAIASVNSVEEDVISFSSA